MKQNIKELEINGTTYVPKESVNQLAESVDGMDYVLVRTYSAGVHVGYLQEKKGKEVVLINSIRIWYWDGAASLSQLAVDGTNKPENCKFSVPVPKIQLTEAIEVIQMTEKAKQSIQNTPSWKK